MATPTYTLIDSTTLGSSAASVTFSSIPAGGDLVIVMSGQTTDGSNCTFKINSDTGANYSYVYMRGDGSAAFSTSTNTASTNYVGYLTANPLNAIIQFFDYSATDKHKSSLVRTNDSSARVFAIANRWANTAAINRIDFILSGGESFAAGMTFYLYDIAKAL